MYTVKIALDKQRKLKFDLNAMAMFEEETGASCFTESTWTDMSARKIRALLWSALLWEDPALTIEMAGSFVTLENMEYVSEKLMEAWQKASPKNEKKKGASSLPSKSSGQ